MELGETTREAAAREAFEETGAILNPSEMALLALYNLPGQVQVVYEAPLPANAKLETSTTESSEIKLFEESDALKADLCFPTVTWALERCFSSLDRCRGVQERTKAFQGGEWRVLIDYVRAGSVQVGVRIIDAEGMGNEQSAAKSTAYLIQLLEGKEQLEVAGYSLTAAEVVLSPPSPPSLVARESTPMPSSEKASQSSSARTTIGGGLADAPAIVAKLQLDRDA